MTAWHRHSRANGNPSGLLAGDSVVAGLNGHMDSCLRGNDVYFDRTLAKSSRMQVDFYHLGAAPIGRVLPRIAERVMTSGARLLVVAEDATFLEALDRDLWAYAADAFLPHGRAGQGGEAHQPVLLSTAIDPLNAARNVALVDGRWRAEALDYDRAFHFFDDDSIDAARAAWRSLNEVAGIERRFWRQDEDGRWTRIA